MQDAEPKPALQPARQGAAPGPGGAKGKVRGRCIERTAAKVAIGIVGPILLPAIQQVEQDRAGDDRHPLIADGKATPGGAQAIRHTRGGIKAKGRSAGQD
jgi:hypothetical protein